MLPNQLMKNRLLRFACLAAAIALPAGFMGTRLEAAPPPIGLNVSSINDYGSNIMFADVIKHARFVRDYATQKNYSIGDANGWPTVDFNLGLWYGASTSRSGTYAVSFTGQATLSPGLGSCTFSNQVYNSGTNTTTATLTVPTGQEGALDVNFTSTKRLPADAPGDGVTNIKIMRPSTEGGSTPLATSVTFTPAFAAMFASVGTLRFMDFSWTNGYGIANWSSRTTPNYFTQANNGAAWEYAVQFCNETSKDMWINVPLIANDDYVTKLAQLIKYGSDGTTPYTSVQANPVYKPLNAGLHCYVEYSNEIWNFGFSQNEKNYLMGNDEIWHYPITTNGLAASWTNGTLSSVADGLNGLHSGADNAPPTPWVMDSYFSGGSTNSGGTYDTTGLTNPAPQAVYQTARVGACTYTIPGLTPNGSYTVRLHFDDPWGSAAGQVLFNVSINSTQVLTNYDPNAGGPMKATIQQFTGILANGSGQIVVATSNGASNIPRISGIEIQSGGVDVAAIDCGDPPSNPTTAWPTNRNCFLDVVFNNSTSIFTTQTPASSSVTSGGDNVHGMKFTSSAAGQITGVRFYKVASETGAHTGRLWDASGNVLATVNFTGETSSGWQQANLSPAVNIAANTVYVVSINANANYGYTDSLQIGPLSYDGDMTVSNWRRQGEREIQISNIFRGVFGDSAMPENASNVPNTNPTVRPLFELADTWFDNFQFNPISYLQDYFNNQYALTAMPDGAITTARPPTYYFWGGGGATYYDPDGGGNYDINSIWTSADYSTTQWIADGTAIGEANYILPNFGRRIAYEGGPELIHNNAVDPIAWADARMTPIVTSHQTAFNQYGGDLLVYYDDTDGYQWGFVADPYITNTPKMNALAQIAASTEAVGTYGTPIPSTIAASSLNEPPGYTGVNTSNMVASGHNTWAGYVINYTGTATAFQIALNAGSAGTGNQAEIYVDGVDSGTITIPNTGNNTTYANSGTITTATLQAGTHAILVKAKAGSYGYFAIMVTGGTVTIPPAPTSLTASATYQRVLLKWSGSAGATGYNIYRGTTAGGESGTPVATGIITTSYTDLGLTNGTTYYYKVAAVDSAGTSPMSNEASGIPLDNVAHIATATTAPTIDGTVDAVWSSAPVNQASHLFNGPIPTGQTFSATWQTMWDATNLYVLIQVANNEPLVSNASSPWAGDDVELYIDSTDSKPASYGAVDFQYELGWGLAAPQETKHSPSSLTGVHSAYKTVAGGWVEEISIPWTTLGTTPVGNNLIGIDLDVVDGFNSGSTKLFWWDTDNTDWNVPASFGTGLLVGSGAPPTPTGLTAAAGNSQVALSWTASTGATAYDVKRSTVSGSGYATVSSPTTTNYTNTGLTNGTTYYFVVDAKNASGTSANSSQVSATPIAGSGTIISLDFVGTGTAMGAAESAGVVAATNWNNGTGVAGSGLALNNSTGTASGATATWTCNNPYTVSITDTPGNMRMMRGYLDTGDATTTTVTVSGLPASITSGYDVYVYCDGDNAGNARSGNYVIGGTTINATDPANVNFSGTFTQANNSAGNYVKFTNLTSASFTLSATPTGLRAPVNAIQIVAHATAPAAPTGLTATPGNTQVALSWSASSGATAYDVKRSTVSGSGYVTVSSPTTTSYTNTGLTNGTTYYYVVDAKNASGTSANSSQASAVPKLTVISLNFQGQNPTAMGAAESAGVVAATNWNNGTGLTGSGFALKDNTGATSGATAAWTADGTWWVGITDTAGNNRMMNGYLDASTSSTTVTISGLPSSLTSAGYDVYVYADGDSTSGRGGNYTIGSTTIGLTDNANFAGTFTQANGSAGNYVKFTNVNSASFTLTAAIVNFRAFVNAIQIVGH